jgi:uncharacterized protein
MSLPPVVKAEKIYIDTSAFYALMDRADPYHRCAVDLWPSLLEDPVCLLTSNYVVSETMALIQHRLGFEAAALWHKDVLGVMRICWVDQVTHQRAHELWLGLRRHQCSQVECVSYVIMHQNRIEKVFTFNRSFADLGFELLAEPQAMG